MRRGRAVWRGSRRVRRNGAGSERLPVRPEELGTRWNAARDSRNGDEGGGARRRHGLEDALLIHPGAVLALATWRALITTTPDLGQSANLEAEEALGILHLPFFCGNTYKQ